MAILDIYVKFLGAHICLAQNAEFSESSVTCLILNIDKNTFLFYLFFEFRIVFDHASLMLRVFRIIIYYSRVC